MVGEKAEKPGTKKKPEAKKADAGDRVRKVTSRAKHLRRETPTTAETAALARGILHQLCVYVFLEGHVQEEEVFSGQIQD